MSPMLESKMWFVHNVRRLVGNDKVLQTLHQQSELISSRLAPALPLDPKTETATVSGVRIEVNGDPLVFPEELLPFIEHTRVPAPDSPVPLYLIETPHYCWIRSRLHVGAIVLDVGANLGLFSMMMAKQVKYGTAGWVHAFEPSPRSRNDLNRLLACNEITNVVVHPQAVSDARGTAVFHDIQVDNVTRESSHLTGLCTEEFTKSLPQDRIEVETLAIDDFTEQYSVYPHLIKIDVEGAEFLVLEGARRCIKRHRPFLVIEIHPNEHGVFDSDRLHRYLDHYGYHYYRQDKTYYCD